MTVEWLGWSAFRLTSPNGKVIFTNPFLENPDKVLSVDDIPRADLILVTNGHGDEIGQTVPLAQKTGARVLTGGPLARWFIEQGVPQEQRAAPFFSPGSVYRMEGITIRGVNSLHSSEISKPSATTPDGGIALGFIVTFENGWTIYFTGSSAVTSDQALWAEMYKPDATIYHMSPDQDVMGMAMSIKLMTTNNPNLGAVMPHHHRAEPAPGQPRVEDVQAALASLGVGIPITNQVRSQVYSFTK